MAEEVASANAGAVQSSTLRLLGLAASFRTKLHSLTRLTIPSGLH